MKTLLSSFAAPLCGVVAAFGLLLAQPAAAQAPAWQWGLQTTNPTPADDSPASGQGVATDAAGNVYVGGNYGASLNPFSPAIDATRRFGSAGSVGPGRGGFVARATAAGQWTWVMAITATGTDPQGYSSLSVSDVTVTTAGDVYATGYLHGTAVRAGSVTQAVGAVGEALFVARFNNTGVCQWLRVVDYNTSAASAQTVDIAAHLAIDPSTGGVVVGGTSTGGQVFGSNTLPATAPGNNVVFVARMSASGQWLGLASTTGTAYISDLQLAVGPAGQVAVATSKRGGTLTFGSITLNSPAGGDGTYAVAQLSPTNQWQWALGGTGLPTSALAGAAYTTAGTLWVAGQGENGTTLGTTTLTVPTSPSPLLNTTGFIGLISATGQWTIVRQLTLSSAGNAAIAFPQVDAAGNVVTVGALIGRSGPLQASTSGGQTITTPANVLSFFTASLNSSGQWNNLTPVPLATPSEGFNPTATALDASGNLYMTGALSGTLTLGSSVLSATMGNNGSDLFLGKLSRATALAARSATQALALTISPNPATSRATLRLPAPAATATLATLTDALGRPVRTYALPAQATSATLDLTGIAPGIYAVRCGEALGRLVVE